MSGNNSGNASTQVIQTVSAQYGIPSWIPLSIAQVESSLNPSATGDVTNGKPTSFGLFQLHQGGGQGDGYTSAQLLDPHLNAQIGIANMIGPYQSGVSQGLSGYSLLSYVAANSGHPDSTGMLPSSYNTKLQQAYSQVTGNNVGTGSSKTNSPYPAPTGIGGALTKGFWGIAGIAVVIAGIWVMFNPEADITSTISQMSKQFAQRKAKGVAPLNEPD